MRRFAREAVSRLFLARQHLDRPFSRPLTAETLTRFVEDAGGLQLDSINVLERAHYLTLWSRFGPYETADLDRWVYERRALIEYWAHAACLVAPADLAGWRRAMADFDTRHTGWSDWLQADARVMRSVQAAMRRRGPLSPSDLEPPAPRGKGAGWWDWKPVHHAFHRLFMSGRLAIHSRRHFHKTYDLASRVLPPGRPLERAGFPRWHLRKTLRALGAAMEADLSRYLTFPRLEPGKRRLALAAMLRSGEAVEAAVEGHPGRWFALAEDLPALEDPQPALGTTLLCPFDSLLWHRGRVQALFGFEYKIEVYTPPARRVYGYYTLPILHRGRLVGRLDPKNHRAERRLEVRGVHFDGKPDEGVSAGTASALRSLAAFLHAEEITAPDGPLRDALRAL